MSDIELMEVSVSSLRLVIGDFHAPVEIAPGVIEYVKVTKDSLIRVLKDNAIGKVQIGIQKLDYRDQIAFIEGVEG